MHGDPFDWLVAKLVGDLHQRGHLLHTRTTPVAPGIEHNYTSKKIGQLPWRPGSPCLHRQFWGRFSTQRRQARWLESMCPPVQLQPALWDLDRNCYRFGLLGTGEDDLVRPMRHATDGF